MKKTGNPNDNDKNIKFDYVQPKLDYLKICNRFLNFEYKINKKLVQILDKLI